MPTFFQHRAAEQGHLRLLAIAAVGELLDAVHVARETGHPRFDDLVRKEDPAKRLADCALAAGVAKAAPRS